jgi:eukaryotic-like serine/threonine-protein kinase
MSPALLAGRYRLLEPLGNGGMGRVWLARDEVLHRDVAIKEVNIPLDLSAAEREELRTRTLREARTAARLSHPNVVQIYDVLGVDDRPWIVMEYVKSQSLQHVLVEEGPVGVPRAAAIGLAILRALDAAHSAGVLHRDVKPGNVLIAEDGRVVLTDFGLATFDGGEASVTRPGLVWGSPEYVAPERAKHGISSVEADLWSLGATLYAAVEGASPFARSTAMASLTALATEKPPAPVHAGALKQVITGLLRKDPRARLRASEVERYLARIVDGDARKPRRLPRQRPAPSGEYGENGGNGEGRSGVPIASYSLPEPPPTDVRQPATLAPEPGPRGPSRRGWLIATAAVLLAVALGGAAMLIVNRDRTDRGTQDADGSSTGAAARPSPTVEPTRLVTSGPALPTDRILPYPGWTFYEEPGRFRMMAPLGWRIEHDGTTTLLHEPDGPKVLSVNRWAVPNGGAMAAAMAKDAAWKAGTQRPPLNYQQVALRAIEYFSGGVEWEYTYTDPATGSMRTVSRWFVDRGICYAIGVSLPDYDIGARTNYFNQLIGGFQPRADP